MKKILNRLFGVVLVLGALNVSGAEETPTKITPIQIAIWNPVQLAPSDWDVWGVRLNILFGNNRDVYGLDIGVVNFVMKDFVGIQVGVANVQLGDISPDNLRALQAAVGGTNVTMRGMPKEDLRKIRAAVFSTNVTEAAISPDSAEFPGTLGVQLGCANISSKICGFQIGGLFNMADALRGLQIANFNSAGSMAGIQIGFLMNSSREAVTGVQVGLVNRHGSDPELIRLIESSNPSVAAFAKNLPGGDYCGLQVGLFSSVYSSPMRGVQLGLSNYAADMHGLQFALVNIADKMAGVQIGLVNIIKESPVAFFPIVNAHF